jgi:DNA-binding response OmpR family regulator
MAPHSPVTILIVDDEPSLVRALVVALGRDGYKVESADNGQSALELIALCRYDVILCDLRMPELDGSAFYSRLLQQYPSLQRKVIFLTGDTLSAESMVFLEQCGQPWMPKPCNLAEVRSAIQQVLHTADGAEP